MCLTFSSFNVLEIKELVLENRIDQRGRKPRMGWAVYERRGRTWHRARPELYETRAAAEEAALRLAGEKT